VAINGHCYSEKGELAGHAGLAVAARNCPRASANPA
jgi:hypothetical protein